MTPPDSMMADFVVSAPSGSERVTRLNIWVREDTPQPMSRGRIAAYGAAALAHVVLLALFAINLAAAPKPIEEEAFDLAALPAVPPKPPEIRIDPPKVKMQLIPMPAPPRPLNVKPPPMELPVPPPAPVARETPPAQPDIAPAPNGQIVPPPTYLSALFNHLARNKRYPREAQIRREQGIAYLRFTMDRQGRVLAYRIERGSGHPDLDAEVEAMIQRAQPLPPLPAEMPDTVEMLIPVQFSLK